MIVQGIVVSVDTDTQVPKKDGGHYQGAELIYKNDKDGKVNTQAWHENALKYNKSLKAALESLKAGDTFAMEKEKDGEYWKVLSVKKTTGQHAPQATAAAPAKQWSKPADDGKWADKAERDANGVRIVRQNALGHALNMLILTGKKTATPDNAIALAKQFEAYVFGAQVDVDKQVDNEDESINEDDIPY